MFLIIRFRCRSCWHAVRKVKVRSRMGLKWCSASQRKLMMPCTCLCWMVSTHTHTYSQMDPYLFLALTLLQSSAVQLISKSAWPVFLKFNLTSHYSLLLFPRSLFLPSGFDGNIDSQGELILQESFQVWDPKTLIRKGRDRHLFLFEMSLVFSKEVKDSNGRSKYLYKSKLFVSNVSPDCIFPIFLILTVTELSVRV